MGNVVSFPISLDSDLGRQLIVDCCRFQEKILTEQQVRKKYRFDEAAWEALGTDEMVRAVEEELARRIRDGSSKRELAQKHIVRGPDILSSILLDESANARHRIDSCKVLNDLAANGPEAVPAADRFQIIIRLDADTTLQFDRSRTVDPNDHDPHHPDDRIFPAITAKKEDDGNGNAI